ncbi:MAG: putative aminohydrolase SsnA [Acidobacteriia bacterium]|nr:putative aminohydrolase SsnA [Terriglobia bacterium]
MLLKNATLIDLNPARVELSHLRVTGSLITARGWHLRKNAGEKVVDLKGKLLLPGMICAHTHLYSALARGMPAVKPAPKNFLEILKKIWWRLDWAHNEETLYYSALVGAMDAALSGTTLLIDHHSSPCHIRGSLKLIMKALQEVGLRGVLCYEVTDRGGMPERDAAIEENVDFISAHADHPRFRGLFGAHASFTLGNDSLRACSHLAGELDSGLHIHVSEDLMDDNDARAKYHRSVIERLDEFGGLNSKTILAHGTHLSPSDVERVKEARSWLVHNPRSNMNNSVGYAFPTRFGERVALGTDGLSSDMFAEAQYAYFKSRDAIFDNRGRKSEAKMEGGPLDVVNSLAQNSKLASEIFGAKFGRLQPGFEADLIVLDYAAPTPITKDNLAGHLIFGLGRDNVESVMVGGRFVVKNRRIPQLDTEKIFSKSSKLARILWDRAF